MAKKVASILFEPADLAVDVRFDEENGQFSAWFKNTLYQNRDYTLLRNAVLDGIRASFDLLWIPIIEVSSVSSAPGADQNISFYLHIERKYIAHHNKLGDKEVFWDCPAEKRIKSCSTFYGGEDFALPSSRHDATSTHLYLPYTDVEWERLQEIRSYFQIAARKTAQLLDSSEGISRLLDTSRSLFDYFTTHQDEEPCEGEDNEC